MKRIITLVWVGLAGVAALCHAQAGVGHFDGRADVGKVGAPGTAAYDEKSGVYSVGGSGENMWFDRDAFHFVWKKVSGDVAIGAEIEVLRSGPEANSHRKGVLMIRQDLDADSAYADVALHGDGLTSLQFREEKGGATREVRTVQTSPRRLRLEKRGDWFYMLAGTDEETMKPTGCSVQLKIDGEFYVGIGVCAHDNQKFEYVRFSGVALEQPGDAARQVRSIVEIVPITSGDRTSVYSSSDYLMAPDWIQGEAALLAYDEENRYQVSLEEGVEPKKLGKRPKGMSEEFDNPIVVGERRYFISDEAGNWQLYRSDAAGGNVLQLTSGSDNNAYARVSPDSSKLLYLTYPSVGTAEDWEANVTLQVLDLETLESRAVASFLGGPDSIGKQPWSDDNTHVTFARYQPQGEE